MVIKKTLSYLLAKGLPGIIGLLSIMVYTRLLNPEIYGQYAIVISLVILTITMCFQWMQFAVLRFHPKESLSEQILLSNISIIFLLVSLFVLPLFALVLGFSFDFLTLPILLIVLFLTLSHAFFDTGIQFSISRGEALSYGLLLFVKAALGLSLGVALFYSGLQLAAPLAGLTGAYFLLVVYFIYKYYKQISWQLFDLELIKSMMQYGIPLSGTFLMNYIMANSDRLMLAWMMGEESAGLYSAGYDLSNFSFIIMLMAIHLAIYPMVLKAYEEANKNLTETLLEQNLISLLLFSILPAILFSFLVLDFSQFIFGEAFWKTASEVIPIVALATFFLGLKAYYFDLAFLLSHKTRKLLVIGIVGAVVNIILNYFFIQQWGIIGAAYATCLSYFTILCLSYWQGKLIFSLPLPWLQILKILLLLAICCLSLYLNHLLLWNNFFIDLLLLAIVYLSMCYYFNFLECQLIFKSLFALLGKKINVL
ncbi:MAG: polysaccharide biosynthesis C-terminal domain-containing protein [Pseudomonadota bacterium]